MYLIFFISNICCAKDSPLRVWPLFTVITTCCKMRCVNCLLCCSQTQNMMYDLVVELQHRSEELDRRIGVLEEKLDSILRGVQSLPLVLSQAITKLQKDFLDDLACRVHFLSSSLSSECCSVPARQLCPGSTTPETPYSWQASHAATFFMLGRIFSTCFLSLVTFIQLHTFTPLSYN